ncbi:MAG: hypothetical protein MUE70_03470 [Desulfobacterales bacterium]|jgi:predicted DNA-binding ArsR family transcriptional regulator|nr:hypothetical protein [Desulfobacterales bacterium]
MDINFLKLWSDAIRQSTPMQTLGDEISRWMKGDIRESDELYALFRKYYGLEQGADVFKDYENQLKGLAGNFQTSFKELLSILGVVPKSEYDNLLEQYDALKKKVAGLEEALKALEKKLGGSPQNQAKAPGVFDEMIKTQTEQFQNIMNTFADISGLTARKDEKK